MDITPSVHDFTQLAAHHTVVPVWGELLACVETPVGAFQKLQGQEASFLLESVEGEEKVARFSFLGSQPRLIISSRGRDMEVVERVAGKRKMRRYQAAKDPLAELQALMRKYRPAPQPGLPRFTGGLVGYLGYNMVRFFERVPAHRAEALKLPDMMMMLTDSIVIFDHAQHKLLVVVNAVVQGEDPARVYQRSVSQVRAIAKQLQRPAARAIRPGRRPAPVGVTSNMSRQEFARIVARAKAYIRGGDIIQTVLSQRLERPVRCEPFDVYRALRSLNPSPYMYFLRFGDTHIIGSSPEMLVRCEDGVVHTRPIAGTRPRGHTDTEDQRLKRQLLASPKERAEHLMLVDLGRNDLGRIAQTGSVATPELMIVEKYSHVMHIVSTVQARLRAGLGAFDVLRATFPAGTVTGAPKVRAMEIIAELERDDRGPYAGAVGYVSFSGNLDTCITIRTIVLNGRRASVQAGAGIVADSEPMREYQETLNKAKGCLEAIERAEAGLDTRL